MSQTPSNIQSFHREEQARELVDEVLNHAASIEIRGELDSLLQHIHYDPKAFRKAVTEKQIFVRQLNDRGVLKSSRQWICKQLWQPGIESDVPVAPFQRVVLLVENCVYQFFFGESTFAVRIRSSENAHIERQRFNHLWCAA